MSHTIGIFGITANPPHLGHIQAINDALNECNEVWISPVFAHAFAKKFINYDTRMEMLEMILEEIIPERFNKTVFIKELDRELYELTHQTPIYSYDVLQFAKKLYPENAFKLIIGADNYKTDVWSKFYKNKEIEKEFGLIICEEKEFIHSTQIRQTLKEMKSVKQINDKTSYLEKYLGKHLGKYVFENGFHEYVLM